MDLCTLEPFHYQWLPPSHNFNFILPLWDHHLLTWTPPFSTRPQQSFDSGLQCTVVHFVHCTNSLAKGTSEPWNPVCAPRMALCALAPGFIYSKERATFCCILVQLYYLKGMCLICWGCSSSSSDLAPLGPHWDLQALLSPLPIMPSPLFPAQIPCSMIIFPPLNSLAPSLLHCIPSKILSLLKLNPSCLCHAAKYV